MNRKLAHTLHTSFFCGSTSTHLHVDMSLIFNSSTPALSVDPGAEARGWWRPEARSSCGGTQYCEWKPCNLFSTWPLKAKWRCFCRWAGVDHSCDDRLTHHLEHSVAAVREFPVSTSVSCVKVNTSYTNSSCGSQWNWSVEHVLSYSTDQLDLCHMLLIFRNLVT